VARLGLMCPGGPASGHSDLGGVRRALPMAELWPGPSPSGHARGRWGELCGKSQGPRRQGPHRQGLRISFTAGPGGLVGP